MNSTGVVFGFTTNSDLVSTVSYKSGSSTVVSGNFTYEDHRNLLLTVENKNDSATTTISKYEYTNDDLDRRTSVANSGTAFTTAISLWTYDDRSELESSKRYTGTYDPEPSSGEVTAQRRTYHYDPIGNRTDITEDTSNHTYYCANSLNQYTLTHDGSGSCPPTTPTFTYDADGNLLADGTLTYVWDAENRLIEVYPISPTGSSEKLKFTYDYMSRRVRKLVYTWNTGTENWNTAASKDLRFVYDGWNVVMVLSSSTTIQKKYIWGLDMSRTMHGAGGIGGLLAVEETAESSSPSYWFLYDANGNVGQAIKSSEFSVAGHYEYDPFGNTITSTGSYAANNTFRFSTKWNEIETGLCY